MSKRTTYAILGILPVVAACSMAAADGGHNTSTDGLLACELRTETANGMTTIEGVVHAAGAVDGSYRLTVEGGGGGGNANINQGGEFSATPDAPATLGRVVLSGGGTYDARLEVSGGGTTVICDELIGGRI